MMKKTLLNTLLSSLILYTSVSLAADAIKPNVTILATGGPSQEAPNQP